MISRGKNVIEVNCFFIICLTQRYVFSTNLRLVLKTIDFVQLGKHITIKLEITVKTCSMYYFNLSYCFMPNKHFNCNDDHIAHELH